MLEIVVCSTKKLKVDAARSLFELNPNFSECTLACVGVSAASDIAEQPIELENGKLGASNRIANAKLRYPPAPNRFYIAIESFFTAPVDTSPPRDHALVIIENDNGERFVYVSDGICVHQSIFYLAAGSDKGQQASGLNETLGSVLAANWGLSSDDWQPQVTVERRGRAQQILTCLRGRTLFW
jgi:non-canonical (house-cleaning) NTP pyrophosphatase